MNVHLVMDAVVYGCAAILVGRRILGDVRARRTYSANPYNSASTSLSRYANLWERRRWRARRNR